MLCDKCGIRPATFVMRRVKDGIEEEIHYCEECVPTNLAKSLQDLSPLEELLEEVFSVYKDLISDGVYEAYENRCQKCGNTLGDVVRTGKFGCSNCYLTFREDLRYLLIELQEGAVAHVGKEYEHSILIDKKLKYKSKIKNLKKRLKKLIAEEKYEKAAEIRDRIKRIKMKISGERNE